MHTIEPFYNWQNYYKSSDDIHSPFYGRVYSEFEFENKVYNYYIHPQWDEFGSETLYLKILFCNYNMGFSVIELIGEWNDLLYNDIMFLKREVIEFLISNGINKFLLIGENVLNFHFSDDSYYEEWFDEINNGWIVGLNFHDHVIQEFQNGNIDQYIYFNNKPNIMDWRTINPLKLFRIIDKSILKRIE